MSESKSVALVPFSDLERMGGAIAKSNLFGIKTPDQAVALMLIAQAEGLHPAIAARDYHIVQGRPALKADAMLARFQAAGGKVKWGDLTNEKVSATFSHPAGGEATISWSIEEAQRIGLAGKDNWRNYPRAMLRSRVVSEGIRTVFPGCVVGTYTPEEVQDFDDKPRQIIDVTPPPQEEKAEESEAAWPLFVPGKGEAYSHHVDEKDWIFNFSELVGKVRRSKLKDEEKAEKIRAFIAANTEIIGWASADGQEEINLITRG